MRRIIPVTQARVFLTNAISAMVVALVAFDPSFSANQRADGREVIITFNIVPDSGEDISVQMITPTI